MKRVIVLAFAALSLAGCNGEWEPYENFIPADDDGKCYIRESGERDDWDGDLRGITRDTYCREDG